MGDIGSIPLSQWTGAEGRPVIIAGPCSAESEEQVLATARRLRAARVDFYRAGIWKARTRPASFEGIGDRALAWLRCARETTGLRTAVEVATAQHVDRALEAGVNLVWIGARTTVNPFSVQEIANALRGATIPVLIKNPTSPDIGLWVGAVERVHRAGVRALGAIHRGFSVAGGSRFRNPPMWELAIEFRRLLPHLPIITDPSHIAGRRDLIQEVSQQALDLGLDGLMIETHPNPDQAWSDAAQQITPERLIEILGRLKVRRATSPDPHFVATLEAMRGEIDHIDHELLQLLATRMRVVESIADCKRTNNVASLQMARWSALLEDRLERAARLGLAPGYAQAVYEIIHRESVRRQNEIMDADSVPGLGAATPAPASRDGDGRRDGDALDASHLEAGKSVASHANDADHDEAGAVDDHRDRD